MHTTRDWFSLIVIAVTTVGAGCRDREAGAAAEAAREAPVPAVEVVEARRGTLPLVERLTGTARASGEVAILAESGGRIVEVLVDNGATVTRGQPLVRLQTVETRPQLAQARAQLAVAEAQVTEAEAGLADLRRQLSRATSLAERGFVSRQEVDTLRSQVDSAAATVARTKAEVGAARAVVSERAARQQQTVVRAPLAGRVGQRNAEVGMLVDPQTPLFVVGRLDRMRVEVPVAQDVLSRLQPGQRVEVMTQTDRPPIVAEVSRISPFLSPGTFSGEVEIDLPNEGALVPGMFVTVDVHYGESDAATLVPTSAVYESPTTGETGVFVPAAAPDELKASLGTLVDTPLEVAFRAVDVLAAGRQTVGVDGVTPGEWVVVVGQHLLGSGGVGQARVRPMSWEQILDLQAVQREDLLRQFMDKQRQQAEGAGAGGPSDE